MSRSSVSYFPSTESQWQPGVDAVEKRLAAMQSRVTAALTIAIVGFVLGLIGMVVGWVVYARKPTVTTTIIQNGTGNWTYSNSSVPVDSGADGSVTLLVAASGRHRDVTILGTLLMLPGDTGVPVNINGLIATADLPFFDFNTNIVSNYPTCTLSGANSPFNFATIMYLFPNGDAEFWLLWVNNVSAAPPPVVGLIQGVAASGTFGPFAIDPSLMCETLVLECRLSWETDDPANLASAAAAAAYRAKSITRPIKWPRANRTSTTPSVAC